MSTNTKKIIAALTSAAVLLVSGCGDAAQKSNSALSELTSAKSSSTESSSTSASSSSAVSRPVSASSISAVSSPGSTSTESVSSSVSSWVISSAEEISQPSSVETSDEPYVPPVQEQTGPAHFNVDPREPLDLPSSAEVRICSLSEALECFSEIESKTPEGTPEEIVQTLMERNILCFAALQAKCWTFDESHADDYWYSRNSGRVFSDYLRSVDQIDALFYGTYLKSKANYLIHYNDGWSVTDTFTQSGNYLYADFSCILKTANDSFETPTYVSILSSSNDQIVFGRYSSSAPSSSEHQPNNYHFRAVKENGKWRLENYIIDAPAYEQPYTELIQTARAGAPDIVELAKGEAGNFGGSRYWGWYGFDTRIEWCAAFVSWCYGNAGLSAPHFTSCNYEGIPWFKNRGQWVGADYRDLAPGDCIFFDWDLDGMANHVGLVIGTDGENVYTIEGNRSDSCQVCAYDLDDDRIFGYGLMKYYQ